MEFIGLKYKIYNEDNGYSFNIQIIENAGKYEAITQFNHPKDGHLAKFTSPVTIISNKYVETPSINVKETLNEHGHMSTMWKLNERNVEEFKLKCIFKGKNLSVGSKLEVLHTNMKKWVSYPLSLIGEIQISD